MVPVGGGVDAVSDPMNDPALQAQMDQVSAACRELTKAYRRLGKTLSAQMNAMAEDFPSANDGSGPTSRTPTQ